MLLSYLLSLVYIVLIISGTPFCTVPFVESSGTVALECTGSDEHCLDQPVEYQCILSIESGLQRLTWRVYNRDGAQIGTREYASNSQDNVPDTIDVFTVEQLSQSPLTSKISFTVQSSIDGYTIVCEDSRNDFNRNCSINVREPPPSPEDIRTTFNNPFAISITWTEPFYDSRCFDVSSYSVLSNVTDSTITTTDTSADVPLAGLSPGVYCVSVATVDTANRIGNYSNEECMELNVPAMVGTIDYQLFAAPDDPTNAIVRLSWTFVQPLINPPLSSVYVSYNSSDEYFVFSLAPSSEMFELTLSRGSQYSVFINGENALGNGTGARLEVYVNASMILPSMLSPSTTFSTPPLPLPSIFSHSVLYQLLPSSPTSSLPSIPSPSTPVTTGTPLVSSITTVSSSRVVVQVVVPIVIVLTVGILATVGVVLLAVVLISKRTNAAKFKQRSTSNESSTENHYIEVGHSGPSTNTGTQNSNHYAEVGHSEPSTSSGIQNSSVGTDKYYAEVGHSEPSTSNGIQNSNVGTDKLPPSAYADIHHFKPTPSNGRGGSRDGGVRPSREDRIEYVDIKCITTAQS